MACSCTVCLARRIAAGNAVRDAYKRTVFAYSDLAGGTDADGAAELAGAAAELTRSAHELALALDAHQHGPVTVRAAEPEA